MGSEGIRIAMWSGPRNISTALLRAWENRPDTVVVDEPLYACYLQLTDVDHPGRDEVIAAGVTDWRQVVAELTGPLPPGIAVSYQKHMAHHLLPQIGRDWLDDVTCAFLVRDPAEMVPSLAQVLERPRLEDTGLPQQVELYERLATSGVSPPVIDARDVLLAPEGMLRRLCGVLGVDFDPRMLAWPAGPRASDGVWARWWYDSVHRSTGFQAYRPPAQPVPGHLRPLVDACRPYYERLARVRLQPS